MKRSIERILTTHTGQPTAGPRDVVELIAATSRARTIREPKRPSSRRRFGARSPTSLPGKSPAGSTSSMTASKAAPITPLTSRTASPAYDGPSSPPLGTGEPRLSRALGDARLFRLAVPASAGLLGPGRVEGLLPRSRPTSRWRRRRPRVAEPLTVFFTSPSPGQIARYLKNQHYPSEDAYLYALADVMAREYRAIVEAGLVLQLDCPDLALSPPHGVRPFEPGRIPQGDRHSRRGAQPRGQRHPARAHAHAHLLGLDSGSPPQGRAAEGHRRHRAQRTAAGVVVPRREPPPRPRMESVEGREAARRQDHHPGRDRFHLELRRASRAGGGPHRAIRARGGAQNVIAGVDCGFGTFAGRCRSTPRSCG